MVVARRLSGYHDFRAQGGTGAPRASAEISVSRREAERQLAHSREGQSNIEDRGDRRARSARGRMGSGLARQSVHLVRRESRDLMTDLLHFEDFTIGRVFDCGTYALTKEEVFDFAREFDPQPHHLDEEAANKSMLKGLSVSGLHVCAIAMRFLADSVILRAKILGGV